MFSFIPLTITAGAQDVDTRQQGPRVGRGAVSVFLWNRRPLCTNGQSHLELPGLKATFTYLSWEGGFGEAVAGHKQTKLIRWQLILDF